MKHLMFALSLSVLLVGCAKEGNRGAGSAMAGEQGAAANGARTESSQGLSYRVPADWTSEEPTTSMRAAQYKIPVGKDEQSPELVLFYFGEGQGGGAAANIDRWISQFEQPDGKPSADKAKRETKTVGQFKVMTVRLNGTYAGSMMGDAKPEPNSRMWAAVVEGKGGPWFFKAVGPQKAMEKADRQFDQLIDSLQPGPEPPASPHGDMPPEGMSSPHGGMSSPHGGMTSPHGGVSSPPEGTPPPPAPKKG